MTTVRLAVSGHLNPARKRSSFAPGERLPALLVSYVYLPMFQKERKNYAFRDWVLDSGAFSAHNSGDVIDLVKFGEDALKLLATDKQLTEVFNLDVIGDWKASLANSRKLVKMKVPAVPCFHYGEPWGLLKDMAAEFPKLALGGLVGVPRNQQDAFIKECFARVWPKRLHGFGIGNEKLIMKYPFHSVDATNWEAGPCRFGNWRSYGKASIRGSRQDLRAEVAHYLQVERRAAFRWRKEMALLGAGGPNVRLAWGGPVKALGLALNKKESA